MARPTTKTDLLSAAAGNYEKRNALIAALTEEELAAPLDFTRDDIKNAGRWRTFWRNTAGNTETGAVIVRSGFLSRRKRVRRVQNRLAWQNKVCYNQRVLFTNN